MKAKTKYWLMMAIGLIVFCLVYVTLLAFAPKGSVWYLIGAFALGCIYVGWLDFVDFMKGLWEKKGE